MKTKCSSFTVFRKVCSISIQCFHKGIRCQTTDFLPAVSPFTNDDVHAWILIEGLGDYFYGDFLLSNSQLNEAEKYFKRAIKSFEKKIALESSIESIINIAEIEYNLYQLKKLQGADKDSIELLQQSIVRRIEVLPLRETYFDEIIKTLSLKIELFEYNITNEFGIKNGVENAQDYVRNLCKLKKVTPENRTKLNHFLLTKPAQKWFSSKKLINCLK